MNLALTHDDSPSGVRLGAADHWVAVWDMGQSCIPPPRFAKREPQMALSLLLEFCMPFVAGRHPLRLWQGVAEASRAIALYAQRDGALRLVHGEADLSTAAGFARPGDMIGMRYFDLRAGPGRSGRVRQPCARTADKGTVGCRACRPARRGLAARR